MHGFTLRAGRAGPPLVARGPYGARQTSGLAPPTQSHPNALARARGRGKKGSTTHARSAPMTSKRRGSVWGALSCRRRRRKKGAGGRVESYEATRSLSRPTEEGRERRRCDDAGRSFPPRPTDRRTGTSTNDATRSTKGTVQRRFRAHFDRCGHWTASPFVRNFEQPLTWAAG